MTDRDMARRARPAFAEWIADLAQDQRLALRALRRSPGFAAIAVLSLALGIGVNTALFSIIASQWLTPVPGVTGADRIVELLLSRDGREMQEWPYPDLAAVMAAESPLATVAGWKKASGSLTVDDVSAHVTVSYVSSAYFEVMGATPTLGRGFAAAEDEGAGQHAVAVLSHSLWQGRFAGDPSIVGRAITLNRTPYTVVGIAPPGFRGQRASAQVDLWAPLVQHPLVQGRGSWMEQRGIHWVLAVARLRDGATLDEANAALQTVFSRLAREYPATNQRKGARAATFGPLPAFNRTEDVLFTALFGALTGLVLLIICGNVAGMLLARNAAREREIAVRLALGAGRRRLLRHLMSEAVVVAVASGVLGVIAAFWSVAVIASRTTVVQLQQVALQPSGRTLVASLVLTLATVITVGLLPALRFSRPELLGSLKHDAGGGARRAGRVHRVAASAQAGMALLFLVVCSLFVRALGVMEARDLGFQPAALMVTVMDTETEGYATPESGQQFLQRLREAAGAVPGVEAVALADGLPLDLVGNFTTVATEQPGEDTRSVAVEFTRAGAGYLAAIGATLQRGRDFLPADEPSSPDVIVITRGLAERLWPGEDAIGRQLWTSLTRDPARPHTVVGVIADTVSSRATENWPQIYVAQRQHYYHRVMLVVRAAGDPTALIDPLQAAILDLDPTLAAPTIVTSADLVQQGMRTQRLTATIAGGFGLLTIALSAIGVYGVVAFAVASRTREIGVRMALGASRQQVLRRVLRDAVRLAIPGLVLGGLAAAAAAFALQSMLLGLSPVDPVSFGLAAAALFAVVLLASLVPARRASATDPMEAVRHE